MLIWDVIISELILFASNMQLTSTTPRYLPAAPQQFRLGDIVEVQFSLVVYQMRTQYYVLKPMLYSIALLDGKYANVSDHP